MLWKRIALTTLVWSKTQCPCDIATQPQIHGNAKQQKWQRRRQRDIDVLAGLALICLTYSLGGASIKCHSLSCNGGDILGAVPRTSEGKLPRLRKCVRGIPPKELAQVYSYCNLLSPIAPHTRQQTNKNVPILGFKK